MGNKCACCSCCQTRPRYKQHVRAAVFNSQIESLGKYAKRTPTQLFDIGRYLKKQIVNNLQNDLRVRHAMESYSCIINFLADDKQYKAIEILDEHVLDCCDLLLLEGFKHNNVDYIMYAMQTLKSVIKSIQDRFFAFQRLSNIFDLLVKIGRSEHMETDYYAFSINHTERSNAINNSNMSLANRSTLYKDNTQNINGFTERTIIYHALDCLKLSVEYSKNQIVDTKFTELMSLFIYNLRAIDITKSMIFQNNNGEIATRKALDTAPNPDNKTSYDIEQIAMKGFELLCSHIAGFNNEKLHFTLEQIEQDIRRYDTEYVLTLLKTISKKSRVNAIDIAKAIANTVKYKNLSASAEVYKVEPATKMIEILIKYSSYCEKSNRYQIISSLCDCIKWLDDIPDVYQPTVPIYDCQQEREKLYVGPINTHTFARIQTLARSNTRRKNNINQTQEETKDNRTASSSVDQEEEQKEIKKKAQAPRSPLTKLGVPSSMFLTTSGSSEIVAVGTNETDKLSVLFKFANKCLECISVYVSYHDIQSTLSRAILPRLNKARSFWHKKYLLHASMETALHKRRITARLRSPLTANILRYILKCPFLNHDTVNELHKNELIDLTQILFQNLALIPSKQYKPHEMQSYLIHVLEFEHMIAKRVFISAEEKPNLSGLDRQSKKWIYSVIYKSITEHVPNPLPIYILKSFSTTINIIFASAPNEDVLCEDLKPLFCVLISLQKYAIHLTQAPSEISYGVLIHTWILSLLFLLARCFNQSSPATQELISRLKNIQHQRQESNEVWQNFAIDEFGLIQTVQTLKDNLTLQQTIRDESVRFPYEVIFGETPSAMLEESIDIMDDDEEDIKEEDHTPKVNIATKVNIVTHLIAFDKLLPIVAKCLNIEDTELKTWIKDASASYLVEIDYQDLFKSATAAENTSGVARSESGDYAPSMTMTLDNTNAWDQTSIPSELYFGFDIFEPPTTVKGHSVRNLFNDDFDSNTRLKWRRNILIKKQIEKMEYYNDVIDVYDAQMTHNENANERYFNNLQRKINAEFESEQLLLMNLRHNYHQHHHHHHHHHHHDNFNIVGIDEDNEDIDTDYNNNKYINKASFKTTTPSLLRYQYKSETDLANIHKTKFATKEDTATSIADAAMYLWIDQDLVTNGEDAMSPIDYDYILMNDRATANNAIFTKEFEYRLGLKQFDFEHGCERSVEFELDAPNFHYIDPNDIHIKDHSFNYHHHHSRAQSHTMFVNYDNYHHDYNVDDSEISSDSDDDLFGFRVKSKQRGKRKKKKTHPRNKKKFDGGQMAKNFKAFSKKLRDGLGDMRQKRHATGATAAGHHAHHAAADSNDNVQIEIVRQQSSPYGITTTNMMHDDTQIDKSLYLRQQMMNASGKDAGSLTDGDEPLTKQSNRMHSSYSMNINRNQKYLGPQNALNHKYNSTNTVLQQQYHKNKHQSHHRRHSSSTSLSNNSSVFDFPGGHTTTAGAGANIKTTNIIEEEDPEYYLSDD